MPEPVQDNELLIRLSCFLGVLAVMVVWEMLAPLRDRAIPRRLRWTSNLGIVVINIVLVRLLFPIGAVGLAVLAEERGWGLFNIVQMAAPLAFMLSVLVLDLAIYLQHVMFHAVPALWRLHRMHHADLEFDLTTGLRFHPIEILLSLLIKFIIILALGPPAVAVLVFEVVLNATAIFNHSNVRIPLGIERVLRWFVVTPDMHRVHHSIHVKETNSNFSFNFPWWDRLFGTYRAQPKDGHEQMLIGIQQFRSVDDLRLDAMLLQPFNGPAKQNPTQGDESTV